MWSHLNNLSNVYSLLAFSKSSRLLILKSEKRNQRYHAQCLFYAMKLYSVITLLSHKDDVNMNIHEFTPVQLSISMTGDNAHRP